MFFDCNILQMSMEDEFCASESKWLKASLVVQMCKFKFAHLKKSRTPVDYRILPLAWNRWLFVSRTIAGLRILTIGMVIQCKFIG